MDQTAPPAPRDGTRPLALVVEAETDLRIVTADRLTEAGFEVLEAWSGPTALLQIERHPGIRLVIAADLPDPDGRFGLVRTLAETLAQTVAEPHAPHPGLVAVSAQPEPEPGVLPAGVRFRPKPLTAALAREERDRVREEADPA